MDKKLIGILLIALLTVVSLVGLNYFISGQLNQTSNSPSPTPTPTPEPTLTPTPTPTPSPSVEPNKPSSGRVSIPEFTVTFEAHPYDVPPEYSVNRYTGETVMTRAGYHVANESIVIRIKSIPFTAYTDTDGNSISLSYSIRAKGHYEQDWIELDTIEFSDSPYIVKSYEYGGDAAKGLFRYIPINGKVGFQVEARIGYYTDDMTNCRRYFTGETSGWSNTKTITFP